MFVLLQFVPSASGAQKRDLIVLPGDAEMSGGYTSVLGARKEPIVFVVRILQVPDVTCMYNNFNFHSHINEFT